MARSFLLIALLSVLVLGAGCATLLNHKDKCKVRLETAYSGASVKIFNRGDFVEEVTTPCEVELVASPGCFRPSKYEFQFSGDKCPKTNIYRNGEITGSYWANLFFCYGAPIGMLFVDPFTGAMFEIDSSSIYVGPYRSDLCPAKPSAPLYRLVSMERVAADDGVTYDFKLALSDAFDITAVKSVQDELGEMVRSAYVGADQAVCRQDVRIAFPVFRVTGGEATGRAVAVAVTVMSMDYDNKTHKGIIRVRYPEAQYEVARSWVREHIETIARDKNIALVTGEIPPAARFYLGAERVLSGNVLEVEFETE